MEFIYCILLSASCGFGGYYYASSRFVLKDKGILTKYIEDLRIGQQQLAIELQESYNYASELEASQDDSFFCSNEEFENPLFDYTNDQLLDALKLEKDKDKKLAIIRELESRKK